MTVDEARANVGRRVFWTGPTGDTEHGVITSVADNGLARVLYDGDAVAQYTEPETVTLAEAHQ